MMYNKSNICKAANELTKRSYNKSDAFKKAWELAKNLISKVAGVSFGKRPAALKRLTYYKPEQISVKLERETYNSFDGNDNGIKLIKNNEVNFLRPGESGVCIFDGDECQLRIFCI